MMQPYINNLIVDYLSTVIPLQINSPTDLRRFLKACMGIICDNISKSHVLFQTANGKQIRYNYEDNPEIDYDDDEDAGAKDLSKPIAKFWSYYVGNSMKDMDPRDIKAMSNDLYQQVRFFCMNPVKVFIPYNLSLYNKGGYNEDNRNANNLPYQMPYRQEVYLGWIFSYRDLVQKFMTIKSHKFDSWHELLTGVKLQLSAKRLKVDLKFTANGITLIKKRTTTFERTRAVVDFDRGS